MTQDGPLVEAQTALLADTDKQSYAEKGANGNGSYYGSVEAPTFRDTVPIVDSHGNPVEEPDDKPNNSRALIYTCAITSSLTSVLLGYDVGVMSAAILYINTDLGLETWETEAIVGSLNLIAAFGGLIAGKSADALGRKTAIAIACIIFIVGATIMTLSQDFWQMLVGRVITGLGVGCGFVVAPVYITEITPPDIRGLLVSLTDVCINLGILLGYISGFAFSVLIASDSLKWRLMIGVGMVPPAIILACLCGLPESPRWLISKGKVEKGYKVLLRVTGDEWDAKDSLQAIQQSMKADKGKAQGWKEILCPKDKVIRAAMFVGLSLGFWQQASGSEAAVYYSPTVLMSAGMTSREQLLLGTVAIGLFKLAGEVVAAFLLDRVGRRPLFMVSSVTSTACLVLIGASFHWHWPAWAMLASLCAFMGCFSLGVGPLTFVVAAEIFPMMVRGKAVSLVVFTNRFLSGVIALSFLSITEALTAGGAFLLFGGISLLSVFFYYFYVPETKGKTLEEITEQLAAEFHQPKPEWASQGRQSINMRGYPSNERLLSIMSSDKMMAAVDSDNALTGLDEKGFFRNRTRSRRNSYLYE